MVRGRLTFADIFGLSKRNSGLEEALEYPVSSFDEFILADPELAPLIDKPDSRLLSGRFTLEAATASGAATNVNLTLNQAWYHDARVRNAYSIPDDTGKFDATVHIVGVGWMALAGEYAEADLPTKDALIQADPYLRAGYGTQIEEYGLTEHILEAFDVVSTTDSTVNVGNTRNRGICLLKEPIRVDLRNGTLQFRTLADVGAAYAGRVVLLGAIAPEDWEVQSALPGQCDPRITVRAMGAQRNWRKLMQRVAASR